jgi:spermidine/putrescine transport system permease protein
MPQPSSRIRIFGMILPAWLVLGTFFLLPLLLMVLISFAQRSAYGQLKPIDDLWRYLRSGAFLSNYARAMEPTYLWIAWRSLWMAAATTILCILIGYPVAYYIAIAANPRRRNLLLALAVVPFWTSFLIRTYAWMLILRTQGVINTVLMSAGIINQPLDLLYNNFAVMVGLVYGELPFMILPLYSSLEKLDRTLLEASADLGAGRPSTFWRVTVPLSGPGMAAGIVLVFIPALGQFVVSDLLGGAKSMLLGNLIQNQFAVARNRPFGAALALQLTAVVLVSLLLYAIYARRRGSEVLP